MNTPPKRKPPDLLTQFRQHEIHSFKDPTHATIIADHNLTGGQDVLRMSNCEGLELSSLRLTGPKGIPGSSNHNLILVNCTYCALADLLLACKWPRSDALNLYNSSHIRTQHCRITGPFLGTDPEDPDIGRAICVDGMGAGGIDQRFYDMDIPSMTISCGRDTLIKNVDITDALQIGGAYGRDKSRSVNGVTIIGGAIDELWIAKSGVNLDAIHLSWCEIRRMTGAAKGLKVTHERDETEDMER